MMLKRTSLLIIPLVYLLSGCGSTPVSDNNSVTVLNTTANNTTSDASNSLLGNSTVTNSTSNTPEVSQNQKPSTEVAKPSPATNATSTKPKESSSSATKPVYHSNTGGSSSDSSSSSSGSGSHSTYTPPPTNYIPNVIRGGNLKVAGSTMSYKQAQVWSEQKANAIAGQYYLDKVVPYQTDSGQTYYLTDIDKLTSNSVLVSSNFFFNTTQVSTSIDDLGTYFTSANIGGTQSAWNTIVNAFISG